MTPDPPILINITEETTPVSVEVGVSPPPASPITVAVAQAPAGADGAPGPPGPGVTVQILSLAAYLALSPAEQMDGTWYVIPKS
jgi:hypothetical protein